MARGLGIDVDRAFMITFALGGGLAGLGGALAIEVVGLDPTFALAYLVYVLIVVAVGGLGSIGGSFAAAAVLGISDMAGKYFPWLGAFLIYLVMVALLMWRPQACLESASAISAQGALAPAGDRVLAVHAAAVRRHAELPLAREPDRDHRALRAVARPDPRLRRHRLARPRGVLRRRRLHRGPARQALLGEPLTGLLLAALAAGIVGYATSHIVVRRHLALIMLTMGLGLLLHEAANSASGLTGGADGLQGSRWHAARLQVRHVRPHGLCVFAAHPVRLLSGVPRIIHSPFGLALRGIRENDAHAGDRRAEPRAPAQGLHHRRGDGRHRRRAATTPPPRCRWRCCPSGARPTCW